MVTLLPATSTLFTAFFTDTFTKTFLAFIKTWRKTFAPIHIFMLSVSSSPSHSSQTIRELVERRVCGAHKKYIISVLISICLSFSSARMWFRYEELLKSSFHLQKFRFQCLSVVSDSSRIFHFSEKSWVEKWISKVKTQKGTMTDKSISPRFILLTCSCR